MKLSLSLALILLVVFTVVFAQARISNETDMKALLEFKSQAAVHRREVLASWNNSSPVCTWIGVTCNRRRERVTSLNLGGFKLAGVISPSIGNLSFLISLNLGDNSFVGTIPQEVGMLFRLQYLNMSFNLLEGKIPHSLSNCYRLSTLDLSSNRLEHNVPSELGSLSKLVIMHLNNNKLTGEFPESLGNLTSLQELDFAFAESANDHSRILTPPDKLNIAIDVASALEYLHVECHDPVAHCDLKPSNVLLSAGVRGTIGYAAPEYGMGGQPSIQGDVYSFGVLVLEMFIGKKPTDVTFAGDYNLHSYAESLLSGDEEEGGGSNAIDEWLRLVLQVGIRCSEEYPIDRVRITEALRELTSIRTKFFTSKTTITEPSHRDAVQSSPREWMLNADIHTIQTPI
ncbi:hypothetical protein F2Q70_00007691 [Brassica cretica]|uniref:Protein kinase domain-containing protein n=1 Tax=Brassica cretica TaxID=69181 RepID=A0A8S9JFG0_BRACR|nr:hypothetical protein F2Q68_00000708 [Brassica cretica]KAF2612159.1 hypothetical protein F2Q70_00007691 [Brassica cretica]